MDDHIIIQALQKLSKVQPGNKISMRNGNMVIDKNSNSIFRWLGGDSRTKTVMIIIELINRAFITRNDEIDSLIFSALPGIVNLKTTYKRDEIICTQLDNVCNRIKSIMI